MTALKPGTRAPPLHLSHDGRQQFSLSEALARGPVWRYSSRFPAPPASTPFPFCREFMKPTDTNVSPSWGSRKIEKRHGRFHKEIQNHFPHPARRHEFLSGVEHLRTDQCPHRILDRAGRRNRDFQRRLDKERHRRVNQRPPKPPQAAPCRCFGRRSKSLTSAPVEGRKTSPRSRAEIGHRSSDLGLDRVGTTDVCSARVCTPQATRTSEFTS